MYEPDPEVWQQIHTRFTYHAPSGHQTARYGRLRRSGKDLATLFVTTSRELSLALTKLEEAIMWANAAIARNEEAPDGPT